MIQPSCHPEVFSTGEVLVDGRELTGKADQFADDIRLGRDVVTQHPGHAAVRLQHCRENPHSRGLASSVRTEQPEDRALFHGEADTVEGPDVLAERLVQILKFNGERHAGLLAGTRPGHACRTAKKLYYLDIKYISN